MSDENALIPIEEQTVLFYEDRITVVIVDTPGDPGIYVPVRPICDYLGIDWSAQRRRIVSDPVLSKRSRSVAVTATEAGGKREMTCIPLDYLNGWLFGVSANRIKNEDIKSRVIKYQDECYQVLARAFTKREQPPSPATFALIQVREMGRAIMQMAEEQMVFERRLTSTEEQVVQTTVVMGNLTERIETLEKRVSPGASVTEDQASQISQAVKAVAMTLSKASGSNQYGSVYGELYRKFGITSYKLLPARRFNEAMEFLTEWNNALINPDDELPF